MEQIDSERWSWCLYQHKEDYILSVVCGSVGIYSQEILLTKSEVVLFNSNGVQVIKELVEQVRSTTNTHRVLKNIDLQNIENVEAVISEYKASALIKP